MSQQVKIPRFYMNCFEWLWNVGDINQWSSEQIQQYATLPVDGTFDGTQVTGIPLGLFTEKSFMAILGHNLDSYGEANSSISFAGSVYASLNNTALDWTNDVVVNAPLNNENGLYPSYDGFSIRSFNGSNTDQYANQFSALNYSDSGNTFVRAGNLILGSYYEMENAPNLSVTQSIEYDTIKEKTSYNGSSYSNQMGYQQPYWQKPKKGWWY